jgi:hypothetical protein
LVLCSSCSEKRDGTSFPYPDDKCSIKGFVYDQAGPVISAVVRIKATEVFTLTDSVGKFIIIPSDSKIPVAITAWAEGYYIGGGLEIQPGETNAEIFLERYSSEDNHDYKWVSSFSEEDNVSNCENCHSNSDGPVTFPFDEWVTDAHSNSAKNIHFLTMYSGMDVSGNQSPSTKYLYHPDYGSVPLPPDTSLPYFGPGYKLDFPETAGNCAACHAPLAAIDAPYDTDPSTSDGIIKEGISCDFCHKILDVNLNRITGEPYPNMPGVLSFKFRRPFEGHQFFAGPFDDVAPGEDTYSPVQKKSQYCAPCHLGFFWGVKIYNSFGEWLESPYSDEKNGKTCQDCHMPTGLNDHFAQIESGGFLRNPSKIKSHRMLGAMDKDFLKDAVSMLVNASLEEDSVKVHVEITNDNTGHYIPTDSPLRHLILMVLATDDEGNNLVQIGGPTLPDWCGKGDKLEGYYAGLPGMAYAKILREYWTEKEPTGAYWKQTQITMDNRIKSFETSTTNYTFSAPKNGKTRLEIKLLFRRAYIELMDQKGWNRDDIIIALETIEI